MTEEHSQQQAENPANSRQESIANSRKNSIPDSRGESKEQREQCQLQAETYEENTVSKKEVGPITRHEVTEKPSTHGSRTRIEGLSRKQENTMSRLERRLKLRSRKQPS